jgi:hypothetical protein
MKYSASTRGFYDEAVHRVIPEDAVDITADDYAALFAGQAAGQCIVADAAGRPVLAAPPPPSPEQIEAALAQQVQQRLDEFAATRGYDGIFSACTYATSGIPAYAAEAAYCVQARDATWGAFYAILAEVSAGNRPMPATIADIEDELPALAWPDEPETPE